jgi:hypothetical protein
MGEKRNVYRLLEGKPEGGPRCRWVDNIKLDLGEIGVHGRVVVKALCYKPEGRGFVTQ